METFVLLGLIAAILLVLVAAAVVLRLFELAVPAFSRWLDEHVGPEPEWRKW